MRVFFQIYGCRSVCIILLNIMSDSRVFHINYFVLEITLSSLCLYLACLKRMFLLVLCFHFLIFSTGLIS